MREVKWVFSFIRGKNIAWMILAWLAGIVTVVLLTVEPKIISHIVDNILIMSVEPGKGGQKFDDSVIYKIDVLKKLKEENN